MGLKGNLAVVNLADVFQMLSRGKSSGLLRVQAPEGTRFIELQDGVISLAGRATQYIQLGDLLLSRKSINDENLGTAMKIHKENGMVLGQVLIEMNYVTRAHLEESLLFLIEEEVCDLFTLREGEFDFLANAALDTKIAPGGGALRLRIEPDSLLLEAARRADEWHELEQRITSQSLLFRLTEEGQRVYQDADGISDEGRVIMRLLQANHTVEGVVQKSCLGRLNTNRMVLELWDAQLIEAVPKNDYLRFAKLQMESGQIADAHRIAVHASKVGSPDTIKLSVPLIDTLRRQLAAEDKPVVAQVVEKRASSATIKKVVGQNLILKKKGYPIWAKIAAAVLLLSALAGGAAVYLSTGVDEHKLASQRLDKLKLDSDTKIRERKFLDALNLAKTFSTSEADLKARHEKIKNDLQIDIDTMFISEYNKLADLNRAGIARSDLVTFEKKLNDYNGVIFGNALALKAQKDLKKLLPTLWERIRTAEFKARLKDLRENKQEWGAEQVIQAYREFLKDAPVEAEPIAREARADLYKLLAPEVEAQRQLTLGRELLDKGGYEASRKVADAVKSLHPGTPFSVGADKILKDIQAREAKAAADLARIHQFILQRKTEEARAAATQLVSSKPPPAIFVDVCEEMRKLQTDAEEKEPDQALQNAVRIAEIDPKKSRGMILDLVTAYPFSKAAAGAMLSVQIVSSPDGATVTYKDKPIGPGKTPMTVQLPVTGPIQLSFSAPGFEPLDVVECNFRSDRITAVLVRKPQASVYAPIVASSGMLVLKDLVLLAGGSELNVCSKSLEVKERINLEAQPLTIKNGDKIEQPPALAKGELKLRGLSANPEDAEAYAFVSCAGSYFFQVPTNGAGNEFHRVACSPGAVGEPQMYRPRIANTIKQISVITRSGIDIFSSERQFIVNKPIPPTGPPDPPLGYAFDGDWYYVVCGDSIYAIDGYRGDKKWNKACKARISLPPAVNPDTKLCAAIDVKGVVTIFNTELFGKEAGSSDLGVASSLGLAAAPTGFVAALDDNTLAFVPSSGGPPAWPPAQLPGKVLFTPQLRIAEKKDRKSVSAAIVCCDTGNSSYMVVAVNLANGSLVWRGRLAAKPVAAAVGPDAVYISTVDSELVRFDFTMPGSY